MKLSSIVWVFILVELVIAIHVSLLMVILNNGFTTEEWLLLFDFKTIGPGSNFFDKLYMIFHERGIYYTTYIIYIGVLETLFKDNYQAYQFTNIFFKILASLSVFPLILVLFKRRLLAFLTTILYSMSYSSVGALQFIVKGSDYLAILFMNISLIAYIYSFTKRKRFYLFVTLILLSLSFIFSPIRIYPLVTFIIPFEIIIWIKRKGLVGLKTALLRLLIILSPYLLVFSIMLLTFPKFTTNYLNEPLILFKFVKYGNYQLLLSPFAGFGYTFLTNNYWPIFGELTLDNFQSYVTFLLKGPFIIYSMLTVLLGFLFTKTPRIFIMRIIILNIAFEVLSYFFITNARNQIGPNIKYFYSISIYAIFFGFFVISVAISSFILWLKDKKTNCLLKPLFIGPLFANIFLWGTWFIIGTNLTFKEGIHWYLIIPPIGTNLFLAGLMMLGLDRIKEANLNVSLKKFFAANIFLVLIPIYFISSQEINATFDNLIHLGYKAIDQENMINKLINYIPKSKNVTPMLFYLEIDKNQEISDTFYMNVLSLVVGFEEKMHFRNLEIVDGCIGLIHEKDKLIESVVVENGIKGFVVNSICVYNRFSVERPQIFYKPANLYAFKLRNKKLINIKEELLNELEF